MKILHFGIGISLFIFTISFKICFGEFDSSSRTNKNDQNFNDPKQKGIYKLNEVTLAELNHYKIIIRDEQTRLIHECFMNETETKLERTRNLANEVIHYLLYRKDDQEITKLAGLLLKPLGEYGANPGEEISKTQKMSVINDWLQHLIFGKSFEDWIVKEIYRLKTLTNETILLFHGNLKRRFLNQLYGNNSLGLLSLEAVNYYQKHLLSEYMPSFMLKLDDYNDRNRLKYMHLSLPEFGYLHVGMKLLADSEVYDNYSNQSVEELIDYGILFENIFQKINSEYNTYFVLPAKLYCVSFLNYTLPRIHWKSCYKKYFSFLDLHHVRNKNSSIKWKTRKELAKQELIIHNISEEYLNQYLQHGDSNRLFKNNQGKEVLLTSIDNIFKKQNKNISDVFGVVNKLLLTNLFNTINLTDKRFIRQAKVDLVRIELINPTSTSYGCVNGGTCYPMLDEGGKLKTRVPENVINMLRCRFDGENERIYALKAEEGSYKLDRVDKNKSLILDLFPHNTLVEEDNFKIQVINLSRIKEEGVDLEVMTNRLSAIHRNQLFETLNYHGYEPTFWQKVVDFLLKLVPFYSCVHEWNHGDPGLAIFSCAMDVLTFIPFIGEGLKVAHVFGTTASQAIISSLRVAARQVTIKEALLQGGKDLASVGIPSIQNAVPFQTYINLGNNFLRTVDPGFGLLRLGGKAFTKLIGKIGIQIEKIIPGSKVLIKALKKKAFPKFSDIDPSKVVIAISPEFNREIAVVKIGKEWGKDIYVRVDLETNALFGRRYNLNVNTRSLQLAPVSIRNLVYKLKTEGLGGKGAINAVKLWEELPFKVRPVLSNSASEWSEYTYVPLKSSKQTGVLYRLDLRWPKEIIEAGGLFPRPAAKYDYDMIMHHNYVYEDVFEGITSAFVSTSPKLDKVLQHIGNLQESIEEKIKQIRSNHVFSENFKMNPIVAVIYKIRPDKNFFYMYDSYMVAGDVYPPGSGAREDLHEAAAWWDYDFDEYLALNGIPKERIIGWVPLYLSDLNSEIINIQWRSNPFYNNAFDKDVSNENVYTYVDIKNREDCMNMGINIVQIITGKNKNDAEKFITNKHIDIEKIVKHYHELSEEELKIMIFD